MPNYQFSLVVPIFNESEVVHISVPVILKVLEGLNIRTQLILVDDGSEDGTLKELIEIKNRNLKSNVDIVILSYRPNLGHMHAIKYGMNFATGEYVGTIDADLQDPPSLIPELLKRFEDNANLDVVQAVRVSRDSDSRFKRITAKLYYRITKAITGIKVIPNAADYRIMTREAKQSLLQNKSKIEVLRVLIPMMEFNVETVPFIREKRAAGSTKYSLWKMIQLASESVIGYSVAPLRLISIIGTACSFLFALGVPITFALYYFFDTLPGWASLVSLLLMTNSIIILSLGIIGEYISKLFIQTTSVNKTILKFEQF